MSNLVSTALDSVRRNALEAMKRALPRRAASPRAALPWSEPAQKVRGVFACELDLAGLSVAVVDDVMRTGASLAELAHTLKKAAAARVENLVVARSLPPSD